MFYSQFILAKKGPLGTIWIAAHLERKLRKNQVAETDIGVTVDSILFPDVPIALRLSGHLLLGVVRIYSRQVNYLFNDCSETLGKIKQAFHSAAVDLPPEATTAPFHTITLPETFDFDELELVPDSESSFLHPNGKFVDQHVTTREHITLQDSIDHNPYLGSSQFGLDERFGDGSYLSFGLDFDEDFLGDKVGSSAGASTSTPLLKEDVTVTVPTIGNESTSKPLLKEDIIVPLIGCENDVTPMDIDDHCEPVKSGCFEVDPLGERAKAIFELGSSSERDNYLNTSVPAISIDPDNEHAESQDARRKDLDFTPVKHDTPGFHAYTPRALEACTPDLNQEYCPPDEPSTPALVDETSLPMYKEFTVENAGRFSPNFLGNFERVAAFETRPGPLPSHQVNPWASSNEAIRSPSGASFQGFTLHQAAPVDNGPCSTQFENAQVSPVQETANAVSTALPSFPQQAYLQQTRAGVSHECANLPANMFDSLLTPSVASLPQLVGNPAAFVNNQWGDALNQVVSTPFQQQGVVAGSYSPKTLFGVETEPSGFRPPSMVLNTMVGQGSTASFVSSSCINNSFLASSESFLPLENVLPAGQMEHMDVDKNLAASKVAASKGPLWQSSGQQFNASSSAVIAPSMSSMGMEECETLRSAYDLQSRSANFFLLQKHTQDNRIPGLELDRNKFFSPIIEGARKELLLPELDKTPVFRDEPSFTAARATVLSAPSFGSVPGDDDVLASILGRRTKVFKVISTPKAEKVPKTKIVTKRPKSVSRATPKRRKVDVDTVAVLHGDIIRQQLANTEDIRRERRKAPCTRREVWGFLRECEGQENFDEPTLSELSSDLRELYQDVVHGRESRPPPLSGATDSVNNDCNNLETPGESDLLAHYVKRLSMKDAYPSQAVGSIENRSFENCPEHLITKEDLCLNQAVGNVENGSLENYLQQPKEDGKEETAAQQICSVGLMGAGDAEASRAEDLSKPEVGAEGKEGNAISFPEAQVSEDTSSIIIRDERTEEQGVQSTEERELEVSRQVQDNLIANSFSEGVLGEDVSNQGVAMVVQQDEISREGQNQGVAMVVQHDTDGQTQGVAVVVQQDTLSTEEQNQGIAMSVQQDIASTEGQSEPSFSLHEQDSHEGRLVLLSKDTNLQALDISLEGKDSTQIPITQAADVDNGVIKEGENKMATSAVSEEPAHFCSNDEEMAVVEPERDADSVDEDNDVAYAEIDYSSDEQDVSIQDDSGWSTRSRNVGKYLKTVFQEMESSSKRLDQGATLGLDRLLARRTRREAARMFFETLVLKTKDYIHVEQNVAYQDILLYPNSKLMKTEF